MNRTAALFSSVMLCVGALTACGGDDKSPATSAPATTVSAQPSAPATTPAKPAAQIVISKNTYSVPAPVRPGQQVTVVNNDESSHTVTSDTNAFDVRISGGGGFSTFTAPTTPGTYPFHCNYHAGMQGSLVVQ
jgi:plastocyanin